MNATARLLQVYKADDETSFWVKLSIEGEGAPKLAWIQYQFEPSSILLKLIVLDKVATRFNEAGWLGFRHASPSMPCSWEMEKLGSRVGFDEVVKGGSPMMHGVDRARCGNRLRLESLDAPVLSAMGPLIDPSDSVILVNQMSPADDVRGVAFNLWNNAWSTNYMFFYPYHEADATMSFDFELHWANTTS